MHTIINTHIYTNYYRYTLFYTIIHAPYFIYTHIFIYTPLCVCVCVYMGLTGGSDGKESACSAGDPGSREDPLEEEMTTHSSILA